MRRIFSKIPSVPRIDPMDRLTSLNATPETDVDSSGHVTTAARARNDNSSTSLGENFPPRDEHLARFEIGVLAAVFSIAILGNSTVLVALVRLARRKKLNRMNEMTLHLVGADLVVAIFGILPQLCWDITEHFRGGDFLCRFVKYTQAVSMYASSYVLLTTAVDRYLAICHPLRFAVFSNHRMHALAGVAWLFSFVFSIPQLVLFSARVQGYYNCWANFGSLFYAQLYVTWYAIAIYFVPAVLLIVLYMRVYLVVRSSARSNRKMIEERSSHISSTTVRSPPRSSDGNESSSWMSARRSECSNVRKPPTRSSQISSAKVKTANYTLTVISSYLFCWGPYFFAMLWRMWDTTAPSEGTHLYPPVFHGRSGSW